MTALWILFSSFCSASILACIRFLSGTLSFVDIAFVEFSFVLIVTTAVMRLKGVSFRTKVWPLHLLRSVIGAGVVITQILTVAHMPVASAQTLQYTSPLFVALFVSFGALKRRERIDFRMLASIFIAFVGICVMFHPSARSFPDDFVPVGLLCGLLTAVSMLLLKKLGAINEPVTRTVFYFHLHGAIIFGALMPFYGSLSGEQLLQIPLCAMLVLLVFGQFARTIGWGKGNTLLGSVLTFSGVVFATLIDCFLFGEIPSFYSLVGMSIIILASAACLILTARNERKKHAGMPLEIPKNSSSTQVES